MAETNDKSFTLRVSEGFLKDVDNWRRDQEEIPTRAEAVRFLVALALALHNNTEVRNYKAKD
ncbi:MAG: hypothetical protein AAFU49_17630 [Pseudomonadota bacterium]